MNLGIGLGGIAGGLIASVDSPGDVHDPLRPRRARSSYVVVLAFIRDAPPAPLAEGESAGSYGEVVRDRLFLGMWTLNFLFVAAGYSLLNLLPPFMRDHGDISERQIGFIFFFNTLAVVLAQLPMSRAGSRPPTASRTGAHARNLGRRVARRRRERLLARGDRRVHRGQRLRDRHRSRRVLPRAGTRRSSARSAATGSAAATARCTASRGGSAAPRDLRSAV